MRNNVCLFDDARHSKSFCFYIKWRRVEMEWGVSGSDGERVREKQIKGEGDLALARIGNGVGCEKCLLEMTPEYLIK
jgi:hypothetical protein